jgi:hypothetical protein
LPKNKPRKILLNSRKPIGQNIHIHAHPKTEKWAGANKRQKLKRETTPNKLVKQATVIPDFIPQQTIKAARTQFAMCSSSDPTSGQIQKRPTQQPTGPKMYMQIHAYLINV